MTAPSYADIGCDKLRRVMRALHMDPDICEQWRPVQEPWVEISNGDAPSYWFIASNDGMPMELSITWRKNEATARIYVEPLGNMAGMSLGRYRLVEDLFLVPRPDTFSVMTAMMWHCRSLPQYTFCLKPQVGDLAAVLTEAMCTSPGDRWSPVCGGGHVDAIESCSASLRATRPAHGPASNERRSRHAR